MRKFIQNSFFLLASIAELIIAAIMFMALAIITIKFAYLIFFVPGYFDSINSLSSFLYNTMNIVIGIEFIKMLVKPTPENVIEVLLFATSRQIIMSHADVSDMAIGIVCIGILFAIKKFLFVHQEETCYSLYRAGHKVKFVNRVEKVKIPLDKGSTLRDVMENELGNRNEKISIDSTIYYNGVALKVANIENGKISSVEIIKEIK